MKEVKKIRLWNRTSQNRAILLREKRKKSFGGYGLRQKADREREVGYMTLDNKNEQK